MKNKIDIGVSVIRYNEHGEALSAEFIPTMKIEANEDLLNQFKKISHNNSAEIKENSELVFASFFSKVNEIELADREEYRITSEVKKCSKFKNGKVKMCMIQFSFEKIGSKHN